VILGSAQQVERDLIKENNLSPKNEKRVQNIVDAVLRMKTVIDGLKFFAREMDSEGKTPTDLSSIIERTLQYSQEMLRAHSVNLTVDAIPPVEINCHPFQITHLLFSLLKNADDALKNVPPSERWIKIKFSLSEGKIQIHIINGGKKISQEIQGKLFQPFFTTKDINLGSGLSLCASKGVALEHGGDLFFNNSYPNTCFSLQMKTHLQK
jgi:two-component system, NtrC family, sensor kinase